MRGLRRDTTEKEEKVDGYCTVTSMVDSVGIALGRSLGLRSSRRNPQSGGVEFRVVMLLLVLLMCSWGLEASSSRYGDEFVLMDPGNRFTSGGVIKNPTGVSPKLQNATYSTKAGIFLGASVELVSELTLLYITFCFGFGFGWMSWFSHLCVFGIPVSKRDFLLSTHLFLTSSSLLNYIDFHPYPLQTSELHSYLYSSSSS